MAYRTFIKVTNLPSFFIYDQGIITELPGVFDYKSLKSYIEEKYNFSCEKIKNKKELEKTISNYANKKKRFFIGIFESENFENSKEILKKLMELNLINVENCFYYENFSKEFLYSNYKNYILVNNGQKLVIFDEIDYLIRYNRAITGDETIEEVNKIQENFSQNFQNFINEKTFPFFEEFFIEEINKFSSRKKDVVIFSYDKSSKIEILNMMKKFLVENSHKEYFTILNFDKKNISNFSEDDLFYLKFSKEIGIYFTDCNFSKYESFLEENMTFNKIRDHAKMKIRKIKNLEIEENVEKIAEDKIEEKKGFYITPKIVAKINETVIEKNYTKENFDINNEKIENVVEYSEKIKENFDKSVSVGNKFKLLVIYFVIYVLIFYLFYRKFNKKEQEFKYN